MQLKLFVAFLVIIPQIAGAQLANNFHKKYSIRKTVGDVFWDWNAGKNDRLPDTNQIIDTFNEKGLMTLHIQVGDTSRLGKVTYTYQYDHAGRVKNKVATYANGEVGFVSLFYYYNENGLRFKNEQIKEHRIRMQDNSVDTFIYDKNELLVSFRSARETKTYFYNDKQELVSIKHWSRDLKKALTEKFELKYNEKGLLSESTSTHRKIELEYDKEGRPVSSNFYAENSLVSKASFYYDTGIND